MPDQVEVCRSCCPGTLPGGALLETVMTWPTGHVKGMYQGWPAPAIARY